MQAVGTTMNVGAQNESSGEKKEIHHFQDPYPHPPVQQAVFVQGAVVAFADHVPPIIKIKFGDMLVVLDDDVSTIVMAQRSGERRVHIPAQNEEALVVCRVIQSGQRLEVSRGAILPTGEVLSYEVLNELVIGWTGHSLSSIQQLTELAFVR
ncbi:MAG: hypothetical protein E6P95_03325 [Candidatus Moraniibacteriota bacterium]|nr:MAG: hypothetical protein E6P95_03325 [Candidatus Moranbacteria bacterium]